MVWERLYRQIMLSRGRGCSDVGPELALADGLLSQSVDQHDASDIATDISGSASVIDSDYLRYGSLDPTEVNMWLRSIAIIVRQPVPEVKFGAS